MKAVILAAGYGTRLESSLEALRLTDKAKYEQVKPFIYGRAKPLVVIAGKPLVQYIVENISGIGKVDEVFIVTNNKFYSQFEAWKNSYHGLPLKVINDGTNTNEERLGAVKDLKMVLSGEKIKDSVLVISGDNLLTFELAEQAKVFYEKKNSVILAYVEPDINKRRKSGVIELDNDGRLIGFEEKPLNPKTEMINPSVYIYSKEVIEKIKKMQVPDNKKDEIGNIQFLLHKTMPFYAFVMDRKVRFDLGSVQEFEEAEKFFRAKK